MDKEIRRRSAVGGQQLTLRPANESDFPSIRRLIHQVGINPMGLDWRRFLIVVDPNDNLLGCGQIKRHNDGSRELASIAVVPEYRGRGIARAVIEKLLEGQTGTLYLTCRAHLGPFYEKFGFQPVSGLSAMPDYFRNISRLVRFFQRTGLMPGRMLVMVRESGYDQPIIEGGR
jgi:N-acetylglutamate synthase-like GNAT family acetyltransferase